MNDDNIRQAVAQGALSSFQALAIALCIALNMLDGFDILAMSFSASGVKAAWNLPNSELGALFSAGLVGMAAGSLLLAPCADVFGRRRIILVSVLIAGAGMLGSVAARGFGELLALRALTGVGIGGTIASVAVLVSEYAPDRWRSAALAAYSTGYPVGATLGGALTALAIPRFGWRSAFAIGGVMTLAESCDDDFGAMAASDSGTIAPAAIQARTVSFSRNRRKLLARATSFNGATVNACAAMRRPWGGARAARSSF